MSTGVYGTIYLSGARTPLLDKAIAAENEKVARTPALDDPDEPYELAAVLPVGVLLTPKSPDRPDDFTPEVASIYPYAGLDNGFFSESGKRRFERLGLSGYIGLAKKAQSLWGDNFLFVTAPDSACAEMDEESTIACRTERRWRETLELSARFLPGLMAEDLPAALVLQNGATPDNIPWKQLRWIFLGGNTSWKVSPVAMACVREARRRGKGVHMGRVNTLHRMRIAEHFGCDSADGTYLLHEQQKGNERQGVESILGWARDSLYRRRLRAEAAWWSEFFRSDTRLEMTDQQIDDDRQQARELFAKEREVSRAFHENAMEAIARENASVARMDERSPYVQSALRKMARMGDLPRRVWPPMPTPGRAAGRVERLVGPRGTFVVEPIGDGKVKMSMYEPGESRKVFSTELDAWSYKNARRTLTAKGYR